MAPSSGRREEDAADDSPGTGPRSVSPLHVLLLGGAALGSGAAVTATIAYKEAGKRLRADGIDPRARRAVLPVALRAAVGSLALTAAAAAGGFWLLRELGAVRDAPTPLPSAAEAWSVLRGGGKSGDGSTLDALSAAWRRREGRGGGNDDAAASSSSAAGYENNEGAAATATALAAAAAAAASQRGSRCHQDEREQQQQAGGWWGWWRGRGGRRREGGQGSEGQSPP